jgi:methylenetetrahydrofolate dehydrogenase (NADP+)/methenyltetrahydrofolate cyclohydrolase
MYKILSGREPAAALLETAKAMVASMKRKPSFAIVLVGNDPASEIYVRKKMEKAMATGVLAKLEKLPENATEGELLALVKKLNKDKDVDGFIVQAPIPKHMDYSRVVDAIDPRKDVDGWTAASMGRMFLGIPGFLPATPAGIIRLLEYHGVKFAGAEAVVVGRGNVVGKPLAFMLLQKDATVTICHSKTKNLAEHTKRADILIAAAGSAGLIKADMVKEGACIVDVGTNKVGDKTVGDVDFNSVIGKANCTPVPGGVGPMTVAMLISNVIEAAKRRNPG